MLNKMLLSFCMLKPVLTKYDLSSVKVEQKSIILLFFSITFRDLRYVLKIVFSLSLS